MRVHPRRWSPPVLRQAVAEASADAPIEVQLFKQELCRSLLRTVHENPMVLAAGAAKLGVRGFGFGAKISSGRVVATRCLRVYVDRKQPQKNLRFRHRVPKEINGRPTDVIQLSSARRQEAFGGDIVRSNHLTAGTLGCVVSRLEGHVRRYYVLSNNHVLAAENRGAIGDPISWQDRFGPGGIFPLGALAEFVPLQFGEAGRNFMDAALALVTHPSDVGVQIHGIGKIAPQPAAPYVGMRVKKFGAGSDLTYGVIEGYHEDYWFNYGQRRALFHGQLAINGGRTVFSVGGDSGSLVVTEDGNEPVGLHFSGSNGLSFCTPIQRVLDTFQVQLVT